MRVKGGLGNQMFQYALGRRLALKNGVPLKLDLTWFKNQSLRRYQLDRFQIAAEIASSQEIEDYQRIERNILTARFYRSLQQRLPVRMRQHIHETCSGFDARILLAPPHSYLDGYWQSENYFLNIAHNIRDEFTLCRPLSSQAHNIASALQSTHSVSLHVRRGDYVSDPHIHQVHGLCTQDYYKHAVDFIQNRMSDAVYYVFSDDHSWVYQNLGFLEPKVCVEIASSDRDVEELVLMAGCQHHIIANSSYSWWGAWLGKNPNKIVIAPQKWFSSPQKKDFGLVPDQWIRF